MKLIEKILLLVSWPFWILLNGCSNNNPGELRDHYAIEGLEAVEFAVFWTDSIEGEHVRRAIALAENEINSGKKLQGRDLVVRYYDDKGDVTHARVIAQEIIENPRMLAVVGHFSSFMTIPNAPTFEYGNVLLMNPASLSPQINTQGYRKVFTNTPNGKQYGASLAKYADSEGYKRIFVYYINDAYGLSVSNGFENEAMRRSMSIAFRNSFNPGGFHMIRNDVMNMQKFDYDAILIVGDFNDIKDLIFMIRQASIEKPIINDGGIDMPGFIEALGDYAEGIVFLTPFSSEKPNQNSASFTEKYKKRFGVLPTANAAKIYDSLHLLAHAANQARSMRPDDLAEYLRTMEPWSGITGEVHFDDEGRVLGKNLLVKQVKNGKSTYLKTLEN